MKRLHQTSSKVIKTEMKPNVAGGGATPDYLKESDAKSGLHTTASLDNPFNRQFCHTGFDEPQQLLFIYLFTFGGGGSKVF